MKTNLKNKAISFRMNGMSIGAIAKNLEVSKSTVSLWVRDVLLNNAQKKILKDNQNNLKLARNKNSELCRERRQQWQQEGREQAKKYKTDVDFITGCILYWGEGGKTVPNTTCFVNSDPDMMFCFLNFLNKYYNVKINKIKTHIYCHLDYGLTYEEIRDFWCNKLQIKNSCFYKPTLLSEQVQTKGKHRKLKYGVCRISVHDVQITQRIFGAIQEIIGFDKHEWLDGGV